MLNLSNRFILIIFVTIITILGVSLEQADGITSNFDTDDEGWSLTTGGGTLSWVSSGGNPGGYLSAQDTAPGYLTAFAPSKFLGDLSSLDKGSLSVDFILLQDTIYNSLPRFGEVTITGSSGSALLDIVSSDPTGNWTTYSAPLSASTWGKNQSTWEAILNDVTEISIIVDSFDYNGDMIGMDNFKLVPVPGTMFLFGSGLLGLAGFRRKFKKK